MRLRNTILTGAASYIQIGSVVLTQLVSIPLALRFLDNERFGLWAFTLQSLGYLLLLDFGVTSSLGRLLTDPLHQGDERTWNGWFNLILAVLLIQSVLILGFGLVLADPILRWFGIPAQLFREARQLWVMVLMLNALTFPLRLFPGILAAQNRSYWVLLGMALGAWVGLLMFYILLKRGCGTLAYGYSAAAQMFISSGLPLVAVMRGPNRFRVSMRDIPWHHARELFGFSSAVFVIIVAVQIVFMSQSLVITKMLGLGAVASFTVCSRVPMLLMQLIWRPFDAFNPRWQIFWAKNQTASLTEEFARMFRFTMGLALLVMTCSLAMNRWFVFIFGKEQLYIGKAFDFFFAIFVMTQVWNHCLGFCFVMAKRIKVFAMITLLDAGFGVVLAIMGTKLFGVNGYIAFTAIYGLVGVALWYVTLNAPRVMNLGTGKLVRNNLAGLLLFFLLLIASLFVFRQFTVKSPAGLLAAEVVVVFVAISLFVGVYWNDLLGFFRRLQNARSGVPAPQSDVI